MQLAIAGAASSLSANRALGQRVEDDAERASRESSHGFGKAKSVLLIYASGGQSHIDMWDPKPHAPAEVRGVFQPIATKTPGVQFTELLPKFATQSDRFAVVRSMSHQDADHGSATYLALTGRYHQRLSSNPAPSASDYPTLGSVFRISDRQKRRFPYRAVHINGPALVPRTPSPGQNGGLLGKAFDPLVLGDVTGGDFAIAGLEDQPNLNADLLHSRFALKRRLEAASNLPIAGRVVEGAEQQWEQAIRLLSTPRIRNAFRLSEETEAERNAYGRHRAGQACLLARRLIEAEAPFVDVIWSHSNRGQDDFPERPDEYGWDTHNDIFSSLKQHLAPRFDATVSHLLTDLDQRGLLDQTLVVCMGEFGRAPKIAKEPGFKGIEPGRKHWANAYSIMLAGAGVAGGSVVGATDRWGSDVITDRLGPWDVAATIFHSLGLDHTHHYRDSLGRPFPRAIGRPIGEVFGG